jgi:hypothetical protein
MGGGSSSGGTSGTGNSPSYSTDWTSTFEEASSKAREAKKGIILYFEPEGAKESHLFFRTKLMQDISKEHLVVRFAYTKDNPLRAGYKVPKDKHVLHICDWFANSLKVFTAPDSKTKFPSPTIEFLMNSLRKTVEALLKKLEGNLKNAEAKLEKGDAPEALKALGDLLTLKGHEITERAKPVIKKIEEAGLKEIEEALKIEDKKARAKELEKIQGRYKNMKSVEDKCAKEIEAATGMAPARETDSVLVRVDTWELVDGLLAAIDWSRRAPSVAERGYKAMCDGLQFEIREEYEKVEVTDGGGRSEGTRSP